MNWKTHLIAATLLALPLTVAPASAKPVDWAVVSDSFDEAAKGAAQVAGRTGVAKCAGYWSSWMKAINDGALERDDLRQLPEALRADKATDYKNGWENALYDADNPDYAGYEKGQTEGNGWLSDGLNGKPEAVSTMVTALGGCTVLPK